MSGGTGFLPSTVWTTKKQTISKMFIDIQQPVDSALTFLSPNVGLVTNNPSEFGSRFHSPFQKGHENAALPGRSPYFPVHHLAFTMRNGPILHRWAALRGEHHSNAAVHSEEQVLELKKGLQKTGDSWMYPWTNVPRKMGNPGFPISRGYLWIIYT